MLHDLILLGTRKAHSDDDGNAHWRARWSDLELLEREVILKTVWGDDGDYIGRTLDVFISKLRKKLEANTNLKIVNIRGVGYKLVIA